MLHWIPTKRREPMSIGSEIVFEALDKFPDTPTLTLAKLIYKDNKEIFTNVDVCRSMIRYYRGQAGNNNLKKLSTKEYVKPPGNRNPFDNVPEGLKFFDNWDPFVMLSNRILVLSDLHIPFHEHEPLIKALEYGKKHNVDGILLNGDFLDFYSCSFWEKDPRRRNFQQEINMGRSILRIIREGFPSAEIVYKIGNHEERYYRYLSVKAPELLGTDRFELASFMDFDNLDIIMVSDKRIVKTGNLSVVHGHEFGRSISSPVNPARGLYLRAKVTSAAGHWHQKSEHNETDMHGEAITCWSFGCLCDLHPDWLPINKWTHGFAIVDVLDDDGRFEVWNKRIVDGKIF